MTYWESRAPAPPTVALETPADVPAPPNRTVAEPESPQRLAWAPVDGAAAYDVELFSGAERVFSTRTRATVLEIPRSWTSDGRQHRLGPGEYRWYVWPVEDDVRASTAVVQAKLTVEG
jgi:hypothetical protein